jgi:16S rRNA (uracil1498-N3)-methyltransferase
MSDRFFTSEPLGPGEFVLDGSEAHHLATVRRFNPGDRVVLFNGNGNEYPSEIVAVQRKQVILQVLSTEPVNRELDFRLEIAAAMPKGDRGEFLVEKLVELGVARFTPLKTERTIVQPKESRLDKLQQVVIEASKQCGRNVLMAIAPLTEWTDLLTRLASEGRPVQRVILHPGGELLSSFSFGIPILFAVGPEGGFTEAEVAAGLTAGWRAASFGQRILRVETAAIAAAARATLQ